MATHAKSELQEWMDRKYAQDRGLHRGLTGKPSPLPPVLRECLQQRLGLLEVCRVKALGELVIDRHEQFVCLGALALLLPQAAQAHGRS